MNIEIPFYDSILSTSTSKKISLSKLHTFIRDGHWRGKVEAVRQCNTKEDISAAKRKLPCVTFSSLSTTRMRDGDVSGLVVVDWDSLSADALESLGGKVKNDERVVMSFLSPSGRGYKAVFNCEKKTHKDMFAAVQDYCEKKFGEKIDSGGSDAKRLCFVSYDKDCYFNPNSSVLEVTEATTHTEEHIPIKHEGEAFADDSTDIEDIRTLLKHIPSRPEYSEWLKICSAVWSVVSLEESIQVLEQWSPPEEELEYQKKYKSRLGEVGIGTLIHLAKEGGLDISEYGKRKKWLGRIRFAEGNLCASEAKSKHTSLDPTVKPKPDISSAIEAGQAGDAALWVSRRGEDWVWLDSCKGWLEYTGGVYERNDSLQWEISTSLAGIYREEKSKISDSRAKKLREWAYVSGVEKFCRGLRATNGSSMDSRPDLLAVKNGVIDFENCLFREHQREDLLTYMAPVHYNEEVACPRWEQFIRDVFPSAALRDYMQRVVGYCLSGYTSEDVLFFAFGKGANGKSTFFAALRLIFGELLHTIPSRTILSQRQDGGSSDYYLASLRGKRIVVTDELPEGKALSEGLVKSLTGGDYVIARKIFESPVSFKPTHKFFLCGNHKPKIAGTDEGIWRRVQLIPFTQTFSSEKKIPRHELLKALASERDGILQWAIRGYVSWRDQGLNPPLEVSAATKEYRLDSDTLGQWLAESLESSPSSSVKVSEAASAFAEWARSNGEANVKATTRFLKAQLLERGYPVEKNRKGVPCVMGFKLKDDDDAALL